MNKDAPSRRKYHGILHCSSKNQLHDQNCCRSRSVRAYPSTYFQPLSLFKTHGNDLWRQQFTITYNPVFGPCRQSSQQKTPLHISSISLQRCFTQLSTLLCFVTGSMFYSFQVTQFHRFQYFLCIALISWCSQLPLNSRLSVTPPRADNYYTILCCCNAFVQWLPTLLIFSLHWLLKYRQILNL